MFNNRSLENASASNRAAPESLISHDPGDEGEAMTQAHFTSGLPEIVLGYLGGDFEIDWLYSRNSFFLRQQFKLFGVKREYLIGQQVATLILRGGEIDIGKALHLVECNVDKYNPHLVHCRIQAVDPLKRSVEGTILQIAAMAGDVGLKPGITNKKEQGAVERIIAAARLSQEEVAEQLKVVNSEEAIRENKARNKQILDAIKKFGEGIIALEYVDELRQACQPLIDQLETDLRPDPQQVITSGYIFDPMILHEASHWYTENYARFGGQGKRDIFIINGYGKLQARLSARDAQVVFGGLRCFTNKPDVPPRLNLYKENLYKEGGSLYFYNLQLRLGIDLYVGYFGASRDAGHAVMQRSAFKLLDQTKKTALQNLCEGPARAELLPAKCLLAKPI